MKFCDLFFCVSVEPSEVTVECESAVDNCAFTDDNESAATSRNQPSADRSEKPEQFELETTREEPKV